MNGTRVSGELVEKAQTHLACSASRSFLYLLSSLIQPATAKKLK